MSRLSNVLAIFALSCISSQENSVEARITKKAEFFDSVGQWASDQLDSAQAAVGDFVDGAEDFVDSLGEPEDADARRNFIQKYYSTLNETIAIDNAATEKAKAKARAQRGYFNGVVENTLPRAMSKFYRERSLFNFPQIQTNLRLQEKNPLALYSNTKYSKHIHKATHHPVWSELFAERPEGERYAVMTYGVVEFLSDDGIQYGFFKERFRLSPNNALAVSRGEKEPYAILRHDLFLVLKDNTSMKEITNHYASALKLQKSTDFSIEPAHSAGAGSRKTKNMALAQAGKSLLRAGAASVADVEKDREELGERIREEFLHTLFSSIIVSMYN